MFNFTLFFTSKDWDKKKITILQENWSNPNSLTLIAKYKISEDTSDTFNEFHDKYGIDGKFLLELREYIENKEISIWCDYRFKKLLKHWEKFDKLTKKYFWIGIWYNWSEEENFVTF